jgi:two-component system, chemotaxis family, protein-glutamate methylesterase/glutaminase
LTVKAKLTNRNIIVIGGSAGAVEGVLRLVRGIPPDLQATLFVVIHTSPSGKGELASLIDRAGHLGCSLAVDGEEYAPGKIYLAVPDHHLIVQNGRMRVVRGPRENRHRPAIDPLFKSAAVSHGPQVIGVILSGTLDDGSAGLSLVKKLGGKAVVQHPGDALFPAMPLNAMNAVEVDHSVPLKDMPELLARLSNEMAGKTMEVPEEDKTEAKIAESKLVSEEEMRKVATPSIFNCPDCNGTLFEYKDGGMLRFRCSIGHSLGAETLLAEQSNQIEAALSASLRSLVENKRLYERLLADFGKRKMLHSEEEMKGKIAEIENHVQVIQGLLSKSQGGL